MVIGRSSFTLQMKGVVASVAGEFGPKELGIIESQDLIIINKEVNFFNRSGNRRELWMSITCFRIELFSVNN